MFDTDRLPEATIYEILANRRRRETLRNLAPDGGPLSLRTLSEEIAARETGESPPPRATRESVYNSLHQTHLPRLDDLGIVSYDREARTVSLAKRARHVNAHMEVRTEHGPTWSEIYRTLGVLGLTTVVAAEASVPLIGAVEALLWATVALLALLVATVAQLWSNRWYLQQLLDA